MDAGAVAPVEFLRLVVDPVRWQLLQELAGGDLRVGELCTAVGKPQSLVSYHLRALRSIGAVSARRSAADGRDTYYRSDLATLVEHLGAVGAALHPSIGVVLHRGGHPPRRRPRVLFLCTGNSARSPMAEALLNLQARGSVVARSAGSQPRPVHRGAVRAMAAHGVDLGGHRPKHLDRLVQQRFDRVVTLCDRVREVCPEFAGDPKMAHWSMADPSAEPAAEGARDPFVRAAAEIEARVALLLAELLVPARPA